jgi:hypothetical protein
MVRARAEVLDAEQDQEKYKTGPEWDKASTAAFLAEYDALDDLLNATPTTIAGVAALLDIFGSDPYAKEACGPGDSVLGMAFNGTDDSPRVIAANELMLEMAAVLRGNGGQV